MSGRGIRLYTDENIDPKIAQQLQRHGYDAISCQGAGNHNQGFDDNWQLTYAATHNRAIVTFDIGDFLALEADWKRNGQPHAGIICVRAKYSVGQFVRLLSHHLDTFDPNIQNDILIWL